VTGNEILATGNRVKQSAKRKRG